MKNKVPNKIYMLMWLKYTVLTAKSRTDNTQRLHSGCRQKRMLATSSWLSKECSIGSHCLPKNEWET